MNKIIATVDNLNAHISRLVSWFTRGGITPLPLSFCVMDLIWAGCHAGIRNVFTRQCCS